MLNKKLLVFIIILLMMSHQFALMVTLPSMPNMVRAFATSGTAIQLTFTLYMIGFGISLFIYGPLSDHYGRRPILLVGISIFIISSMLALSAQSIYILLLARLLQGLGLGCGDVMGRAILCDVYDEKGFIRAASYISMASPIIPIVAPIVGGYMETLYHWRAGYVLMLSLGVLDLLLIYKLLSETNTQKRTHSEIAHSIKGLAIYMGSNIKMVLKNPIFIGFFVPGVAAAVGDLSYSLIGPFVIQNQLGWTPVAYGWLAVVTASGIFTGALISNRLSHKLSTRAIVLCGLSMLITGGVGMLIASLFNYVTVFSMLIPMMLYLGGAGVIYPSTNAGALTPFSHIAGIVGAVQGGLQTTLTGCIGMLIAGANLHTQFALASILISASIIAVLIFLALIYKRQH